MKIMITGATGLVGRQCVAHWKDQHDLMLVGREKAKLQRFFPDAHEMLTWDMLQQQGSSALKSVDVIVNLAGENIGEQRWSEKRKQQILQSRVKTTALIARLCAELSPQDAPRILNAGAIGIYGILPSVEAQETTLFDEDANLPVEPTDFLAEVGAKWEQALHSAQKAGVSVVKMRFGVVLTREGGMLAKLIPSFRWDLGMVIGSGDQPISWVALPDLIAAMDFILEHPKLQGAINIVADEVVNQKKFAQALAKSLRRHCFFTMPSWLVVKLFGEMGKVLLLNGVCVRSKRLREAGFTFKFPKITKALMHLVHEK